MADVILFHHIRGLTPGVIAFADDLRERGHTVHTPDLFDGQTFTSIEAGGAFVEELGFGELLARGQRAADVHEEVTVFGGFSLGVLPAQMLAQTQSRARGAVFLEGCVPPSEFGEQWPHGVGVQIHGMADDPFFAGEGDIDVAREIVEHAGAGAPAELFIYPGDQHLFTDRSLPSFDEQAALLVLERVSTFLARLDS